MDMEVFFLLLSLGQVVAIYAERNLPSLLKNSTAYKEKKYKQALTDVFMEIDRRLKTQEGREEVASIYEEVKKTLPVNNKLENPRESIKVDISRLADRSGCTACVTLITKDEIYVANAGDSRCVLSKNGVAVNMSEDHKPELELERIRIEKAGGYVKENRVNEIISLSRALGNLDFKSKKRLKEDEQLIICVPEIVVQKITSECELLILACDGIWDCLGSQNAIDFIAERLNEFVEDDPTRITEIISEMMDSIISKDKSKDEGIGCDNMTCIVICFNK